MTDTTPHSVAIVTRRHCIILIAILALAAVLRVDGVGLPSLWVDEFFAIRHAAGRPLNGDRTELPSNVLITNAPNPASMVDAKPAHKIWRSLDSDMHPALYFASLRVWLAAFGDSDSSARMLSVVCSLVSIALLFDVCRLLHRPAPALWASAIMAIAVTQIRYAQEARNYAMATMLMLAACDALARMEVLGASRRRAIALGIASFAMPLTLYLTLPPLAAMGFYSIVRLRGAARRLALCAFSIALIAFIVVGGPLVWKQRQVASALDARRDAPEGHVVRTIERTLTIPIRYFNFLAEPNPITSAVPGSNVLQRWMPFVPAIVVFAIAPIVWVTRRRTDMTLWILILFASVAPPVFTDLYRTTGQLRLIRFPLLGAPAAYALIALLFWGSFPRARWMAHALSAATVAAAAFTLPLKYDTGKPDCSALAAELRALATPDDAILFAGSDLGPWYPESMYDSVMRYLWPAPCPVALVVDSKPIDDALLSALRARRNVYLVWGSQLTEPPSVFPGGRARLISKYRDFGYLLRIDFNER